MRSYGIAALIAVVVGLAAGLGYAWFVQPVVYIDVTPAELYPEYRATWITLVAASYEVERDWARASFRLDSLGERDAGPLVVDVLRTSIAQMQPSPILRALARLADRLGQRSPEMMVYLATPLPSLTPAPTRPTPSQTPSPPPVITPSPTFELPPSPTPLPSLTPTPTRRPDYLLVRQDRLCESGLPASQIRVVVEDENGQGVRGVEVWISWEGGADRLVTGLKPEVGSGYGDFDMQPNLTYAVSVGNSALPLAQGLQAEVCPSSLPTQTVYAVWLLAFRTIPPTPTPTPSLTPIPSPTLEPSPGG